MSWHGTPLRRNDINYHLKRIDALRDIVDNMLSRGYAVDLERRFLQTAKKHIDNLADWADINHNNKQEEVQ